MKKILSLIILSYLLITQCFADGLDANAVLLLHCDGANTSTSFPDASNTNATVTANGNAQVSTASPKFGTGSSLYDGSGDGLVVTNNAAWNFGTGAFTIECQANWTATGGNYYILSRNAVSAGNDCDILHSSNAFTCYINGVAVISAAAFTPSLGQWYHIAFVRDGSNNCYLFVDGVQKGSTGSNNGNISNSDDFNIGWYSVLTGFFNGKIDEVRFSNIARWTSNFTPPTQAYSASTSNSSKFLAVMHE